MQRAIKELYVTRDDKHSIKTRPPLARLSVSKVFWVMNSFGVMVRVRVHLTMCFRAAAGALVSQVKRARATASARALDRTRVRVEIRVYVKPSCSAAKP